MPYIPPEKRVKVSLSRHEVEATGKPFYTWYKEVPKGFVSKTQAKAMDKPVKKDEKPVAYVLNRLWNGYLPLYDWREKKGGMTSETNISREK